MLALRCDRQSVNLDDNAPILISLRCVNLTHLKLHGCCKLTNLGIVVFAKNCKGLKKFSCGSCMFGVKGINAVLDHCSSLEELSVKCLCGINNSGGVAIAAKPIAQRRLNSHGKESKAKESGGKGKGKQAVGGSDDSTSKSKGKSVKTDGFWILFLARHILCEKQGKINEAYKKLQDCWKSNGDKVPPAEFAKLAAEYSECPSGKKGGDLGWFPRGKMAGPFQVVAFITPVGATSAPFKSIMDTTLSCPKRGRIDRTWHSKLGSVGLSTMKSKLRFAGDLLMELGAGVELATTAVPHLFLPLACATNLAKNVGAVTSTSTRTPIYKAFPKGENIGDAAAKGECVGNVADLRHHGDILEDPAKEPNKDMYMMTIGPEDAPNQPEYVQIGMVSGLPVSVNGKEFSPASLLSELNEIGGHIIFFLFKNLTLSFIDCMVDPRTCISVTPCIVQLGENHFKSKSWGHQMHLVLAHQKSSIINNIQVPEVKRRKRHRRKHFENQEPCLMSGVYFKNMKWQAAIKVDKKQIHLGTVGSQEAAARLYDSDHHSDGGGDFKIEERSWDQFLTELHLNLSQIFGMLASLTKWRSQQIQVLTMG
ncbi:unnamed protein product [Camellia sinensis]